MSDWTLVSSPVKGGDYWYLPHKVVMGCRGTASTGRDHDSACASKCPKTLACSAGADRWRSPEVTLGNCQPRKPGVRQGRGWGSGRLNTAPPSSSRPAAAQAGTWRAQLSVCRVGTEGFIWSREALTGNILHAVWVWVTELLESGTEGCTEPWAPVRCSRPAPCSVWLSFCWAGGCGAESQASPVGSGASHLCVCALTFCLVCLVLLDGFQGFGVLAYFFCWIACLFKWFLRALLIYSVYKPYFSYMFRLFS